MFLDYNSQKPSTPLLLARISGSWSPRTSGGPRLGTTVPKYKCTTLAHKSTVQCMSNWLSFSNHNKNILASILISLKLYCPNLSISQYWGKKRERKLARESWRTVHSRSGKGGEDWVLQMWLSCNCRCGCVAIPTSCSQHSQWWGMMEVSLAV